MLVPRRLILIAIALLALGSSLHAEPPGDRPLRVYIGTYTGSGSKGIYVAHFDPADGHFSAANLAIDLESPSFLAVHPNQKFMYAVSENYGHGTVMALSINPDDSLTLLNTQSSGGKGPCYVTTDPSGRVALVANYGDGIFESLPITADGKLAGPASVIHDEGHSVNKSRQEGPHAHSINPDPAGHFAFGCDLGLDHVQIFQLDTEHGTLTADQPAFAEVPPGSGPRHLAFHPNGRFVYVISEIANTITAFTYQPATGEMKSIQTLSTLPADFHGQSYCAEVQVHPSGQFLYGSNRGDDSLALFTIDQATGQLTPHGQFKTGGKTPRNFRMDPTGKWLMAANQDSGTVNLFRIDAATGALTPSGSRFVPSPCCIRFAQTASPQ